MLGVEPYFDEPFYVGYNIAGHELGLLPDGDPADGAITYFAEHWATHAMKLPPYETIENLPGVGPSIAADYRRLGVTTAAVAVSRGSRLQSRGQRIFGASGRLPTDQDG